MNARAVAVAATLLLTAAVQADENPTYASWFTDPLTSFIDPAK